MKQRCQNRKCRAYRNYGGRGIRVCDDWQTFEPFFEWAVSNGYANGLDIDRIDNNGDYSPENCRWVTRRENINNRRKTIVLTVNGVTMPRTQWEKTANLPDGILKAWFERHGREYAEKRLSNVLEHGYSERDYGYSHCKAIAHLESGKVFASVREAATYFGIAPCTISNAMRNKRSTLKGQFEWRIEDV